MRKTKTYLGLAVSVIIFIASIAMPLEIFAAQGQIYISLSQTDIKIGDTVVITAKAVNNNNESITTSMKFNFDQSLFSFVSCSESDYGGGEGGILTTSGSNVTLKLKAVKSGSGGISVNGDSEVTGASTAVTVSQGTSDNQSNESNSSEDSSQSQSEQSDNLNKSSDNSLSELKISPGTLSPEFQYSVTSYTVSVGEDVTELTVDAKASNSNAEIESIEGNKNLKSGENIVKIKVKAENGAVAIYTITVTKRGTGGVNQNETGSQNDEGNSDEGGNNNDETGQSNGNEASAGNGEITIGGIQYTVSSDFDSQKIPEDFQETAISYMGEEVKAARFEHGHITLLYLTSENESGMNGFYVYNEVQNVFQPYVRLTVGSKYVIILYPSLSAEIPDGYSQTELTVSKQNGLIGFAYQGESESMEDLDEKDKDDKDETLNQEEESTNVGNGVTSLLNKTVKAHASEGSNENQPDEDSPEQQSSYGEAVDAEIADFYLLYGMNSEGVEGWYRYDSKDQSVQRFVVSETMESDDSNALLSAQKALNDLDKRYKDEKSSSRRWIAILIFVVIVLIIVIVNLIFFREKRDDLVEDKKERIFSIRNRLNESKTFIKANHEEETIGEGEKNISAEIESEPEKIEEEQPNVQEISQEERDFEIIDLNDL